MALRVYRTVVLFFCATLSLLPVPQAWAGTGHSGTRTQLPPSSRATTESFVASQPNSLPEEIPSDQARDVILKAGTNAAKEGTLQNWKTRSGRRLRLFRTRKRGEPSFSVQTLAAAPFWEKWRFPTEELFHNVSHAPFGWPKFWPTPTETLTDQESDDERYRRLYQVHHWMTTFPPKAVSLRQGHSGSKDVAAKQILQQQASEDARHAVMHGPSELPDDFGPAAGTSEAPPCSEFNAGYCPYTEDYPIDVVTEVTRFLRWPLEKLFRDLRQSQSPPLADDGSGSLDCDTVTRIVRPGWAKNTLGRWLVVINTLYYEQFVTEISCRYENSACNLVAPCFYASCQQRYNLQTLLVIDPTDPYKGPFLSRFLFPSCCVCLAPGGDNQRTTTSHKYSVEH